MAATKMGTAAASAYLAKTAQHNTYLIVFVPLIILFMNSLPMIAQN
jgi:hypothetical protein